MTEFSGRRQGPVAIGGVGGSGTRVVAQIVRNLGIYIGGSLNSSLDNLWFTILFKRPDWYQRFPSNNDTRSAICLFKRAMVNGLAADISPKEAAHIRALAAQSEFFLRPTGARREDGERLIGSQAPDDSKYIGWGWKEPNTHVFLEQLCRELEELRYIHVIRHGLDMAFSSNQDQIVNWGRYFGVEDEKIHRLDAAGMLDYWIAANEKAIRQGEALLKGRFFLLNYDQLWATPYKVVKQLSDFLAIDPDPAESMHLAALPKRPSSAKRFATQEMSQFSATQIAAVERLGFDTKG